MTGDQRFLLVLVMLWVLVLTVSTAITDARIDALQATVAELEEDDAAAVCESGRTAYREQVTCLRVTYSGGLVP